MKKNLHKLSGNKPKVLFIEYAQGFGGSVISLSESLKGMTNIEPIVLILQDKKEIEDLYSKYILIKRKLYFTYLSKQKYMEIIKIIARIKLLNKMFVLPFVVMEKIEQMFFVRFISKIVTKYNVELIYSNNGYNDSTVAAAKKNNIPCTLHFRGYKNIPYPFNEINRNYPSLHFAISKFVSNYLFNSGVPKEKIFTIHNSVDLNRFKKPCNMKNEIRAALDLNDNTVAIGIFGRITDWKGQKEFIEVVSRLADNKKISFKAFIIGDYSDTECEYFNHIVKLSENLLHSKKLVLTGYKSNVEDYYAAMDIVVHASNVAEPFGRVVIEAMAAGTAIIAMNEGGPAEVIEHNKNGLLVEPRSIQSLYDSIELLCLDVNFREQLAKNGKEMVAKNYAPEIIGAKIESKLLPIVKGFSC